MRRFIPRQCAMSRLTGTHGLIITLMPLLAHVIALRPTPAQVTLFLKAAGCARMAYNWGLEQWCWEYQAGGKPNWMALQKAFVASIDATYPFMREVPSSAYSQPFRHLNQAFQRFFAGNARRPRFKSKHRDQPSFKAGKVRFSDQHIILPVIGAVRSTEALRWAGRVVSSTVRADADRWTITILCDVPEEAAQPPPAPPTTAVLGIDLGLRAFASCSDGRQFLAPQPLRCHAKRLRRASRRLSRRQKGSRRRQSARRRVARIHRRIRNIRSAFLHPLSTSIVRENQTIVIEDLHIHGMLKNHHLARAISDAGWHEFRRQLTYKCLRYRRTLLAAHSFYPSSKLCCQCGNHNPALTLKERVYDCSVCGNRMDRDINAAKNLSTLAYGGIDARGELTALVLAGCLPVQPARRSVNPGSRKRVKNGPAELSG
jgi:putative transposase